jgi:hypothetical protein
MKRLPPTATDGELLGAVCEWVGLLAEERYQDAYDFLYHPWLPVLPVNEPDVANIKDAVANYGWDQPHPAGPFKVTPVEAAAPKHSPPFDKPLQDIRRYEEPVERAWDSILVQHGGTASGASRIGDIYFDLPLTGQWSDLTAIFGIALFDGALVLALESIDVL